jgi:colicin import membrane protein
MLRRRIDDHYMAAMAAYKAQQAAAEKAAAEKAAAEKAAAEKAAAEKALANTGKEKTKRRARDEVDATLILPEGTERQGQGYEIYDPSPIHRPKQKKKSRSAPLSREEMEELLGSLRENARPTVIHGASAAEILKLFSTDVSDEEKQQLRQRFSGSVSELKRLVELEQAIRVSYRFMCAFF